MTQVQEKPIDTETDVVCSDFDDDCKDVTNKTICWMHQPECGLCPFLKGDQGMSWPFPQHPNPLDRGNRVPRFNPDNHEDAPL